MKNLDAISSKCFRRWFSDVIEFDSPDYLSDSDAPKMYNNLCSDGDSNNHAFLFFAQIIIGESHNPHHSMYFKVLNVIQELKQLVQKSSTLFVRFNVVKQRDSTRKENITDKVRLIRPCSYRRFNLGCVSVGPIESFV